MKLLLYCTKSKPYLYKLFTRPFNLTDEINSNLRLNGKVVAECDYEIEKITYKDNNYYFEFKHAFDSLRKSSLSFTELDNYLKHNNGYAIHIKNLNIYKSPRELYSYSCVKAPQNMQYVYSCYDKNEYVLISIQPQWLCKILNGEKTIEVRKKVLKRMLYE